MIKTTAIHLHSRMRQQFLNRGWLLVAWLPLCQILGYAVFNFTAAFYLLWAVLALLGMPLRLPRVMVWLYVALLAGYLLGVILSADPSDSFRSWGVFSLYSVFWVLVVWRIGNQVDLRHQLARAFGGVAVIILIVLYVKLVYFHLARPGFDPQLLLQKDNLPFLMPFIFYLISRSSLSIILRRVAVTGAITVILAYIVMSLGRAALLGMVAGLMVYAGLILPVRQRRWLPLVLIAAVLFALAGRHHPWVMIHEESLSVYQTLNRISSQRLSIWKHALESPPERIWTGAGMGRSKDSASAHEAQVKHLHNFMLDCWYETGRLGLIALLLWLGYLIIRSLRRLPQCLPVQRPLMVTWLAAAAAIMTSALFSFSYASKQFALYQFMFLALAATTIIHRPDAPRR